MRFKLYNSKSVSYGATVILIGVPFTFILLVQRVPDPFKHVVRLKITFN